MAEEIDTFQDMAKEEILLPVEMERLKIEPIIINKNCKEENPFLQGTYHRQSFFTRAFAPSLKCTCQKNKSLAILKRKSTKIVKEPVLKLLQDCKHIKQESPLVNGDGLPYAPSSDVLSLCTLVDNCNQLRISTNYNDKLNKNVLGNGCKWWNKETTLANQSKTEKAIPGSSCSQQALNPPCDVTIDELASYFETLVHIPKKMSSMAEMMYI